jgi:tryptophan halogenase
MSLQDTSQLLVFGNTLAASMTALALSKALPKSFKIIWVKPNKPCPSDLLYGGITSPEAYQFNLQLGVSEPQLILDTDTTFTFGTHFNRWGHNNLTWMQCFHLPFAATSGVEFHHFMTRHKEVLGDFLISTQAALKGTFAHPPTDNLQSPLSRAEYGYHFDPSQWSAVFFDNIDKTRVTVINGDITTLEHNQDHIDFVQLDDGQKLQADLYIDCSGTGSKLLGALNNDFVKQRNVHFKDETLACTETGPARRSITGTEFGWQSLTPLRQKNHSVSMFEALFADEQAACQTFTLGHRKRAWQGNCVGIGHAAYALEPITPAPYILLKKDIERLLELIPINKEAPIERQEYNRRSENDLTHAELFHRAIYAGQRDVGYDNSDKLTRKITQYLHRGILTSYDFEPFNEQDWAILHAGLGRIPERYDRLAEQTDYEKTQANLDTMRAGIAHLASRMPAHHIYLEKLSIYLRESGKHGK